MNKPKNILPSMFLLGQQNLSRGLMLNDGGGYRHY